MRGEVSLVKDLSPDFALFQEVDIYGTRSWHIGEDAYLDDVMGNSEFNKVFAQNYDSPYLFYPLINPHGANQSGILTLSRHPISSAVRRSLPIETGIMKLVDLDRCYSVSRVPMENGRELVLYNLHLSAYTSDGTIATEQLEMLCADMLAEYENGNYCVAGGDFNKDLLGNSAEIFGVAGGENDTWAQPSPRGRSPDGLSLVVPFDPEHPVATCRTANEPYNEETTFRVTVDGFLGLRQRRSRLRRCRRRKLPLLRPQSHLYGLHFEGGIKRQKVKEASLTARFLFILFHLSSAITVS